MMFCHNTAHVGSSQSFIWIHIVSWPFLMMLLTCLIYTTWNRSAAGYLSRLLHRAVGVAWHSCQHSSILKVYFMPASIMCSTTADLSGLCSCMCHRREVYFMYDVRVSWWQYTVQSQATFNVEFVQHFRYCLYIPHERLRWWLLCLHNIFIHKTVIHPSPFDRSIWSVFAQKKTHCFSPQVNYTDQATTACRWS